MREALIDPRRLERKVFTGFVKSNEFVKSYDQFSEKYWIINGFYLSINLHTLP